MTLYNELTINRLDLEQFQQFGLKIGKKLKGGEVIELSSDLGGGKTTLAKTIVKGAGSNDNVTSPSFTIANLYQAINFNIQHFDFYRLTEPGIIKLQIEESINSKRDVIIVEWGQSVAQVLPPQRLIIKINFEDFDTRSLSIRFPKSYDYLLKE
jgi:tRNA threonylcarbamoyladenosine biosynthesis protein TsaE